MKYKRPRCENCGVKLFPKNQVFRKASFLTGELPNHCPDCGKKITGRNEAQLEDYSKFFSTMICLVYIIFLIVIFGFFGVPILTAN